MIIPNLTIEADLWSRGFKYIAGIDEVGRGALAGPVVAGAVIFKSSALIPEGIADSKLLTPKKREFLNPLIQNSALAWSVGEASEQEIDQMGISLATQTAMTRAISSLSISPDFLLIDYFTLPSFSTESQKGVKDGDKICASISSASIVAKVYRDNLMRTFDDNSEFAKYQFGKHKGYGTDLHLKAIEKYGASNIHRLSFINNKCQEKN